MTGCLSGQREDSHAESSTISEIVRVRTGHICGWCTTYSETEVILEGEWMTTVSRSDTSNNSGVTVKYKVKKEDWQELRRSIDARVLAASSGALGCPGCADQPVEWLEVQFSDGTKRSVSYNAGDAAAPISALLQRIRVIAEKSQISRKEVPHLRPDL